MLHRYLPIGRWDINFYFAVDGYDVEEILAALSEFNVPDKFFSRIVEIMKRGEDNSGFIFSDSDLMKAVIVIGPTSSGDEFINTLVHEIHHLAVAIASNLGVDLESETPAYLSGNAAQELAKLICQYGCSECRN